MPKDYNALYQAKKSDFDAFHADVLHFAVEEFHFPASVLTAITLSKRLDDLIIQAFPEQDRRNLGADDKIGFYTALSSQHPKIVFADRTTAKLFRASVVLLDTYDNPVMSAVMAAAQHEGKLTRSFLSVMTDTYAEEDAENQRYNTVFDAESERDRRLELSRAYKSAVEQHLEADRTALEEVVDTDDAQRVLIEASQAEVIRLNRILQVLSDCPAHEGKQHVRSLLRGLESTGGVAAGNEALYQDIAQSPLAVGEAVQKSLARFDLASPSDDSLPVGENREEKIRSLIIYMLQHPDSCGPVVLRNLDLTAVDLSNLNLSNIDSTGAKFVGAKLSGTQLAGTQLAGATFENADLTGVLVSGATPLPFAFHFTYQDALLAHNGLSDDVIRPVRDQYFLMNGKEAPRINGIFELLQFVQDHPNDAFAKQLDRALTVYAIKQKAFAPVQMSEKDSAVFQELHADAFERNYLKGLGQEQLYQVMQSMRMGFPPEVVVARSESVEAMPADSQPHLLDDEAEETMMVADSDDRSVSQGADALSYPVAVKPLSVTRYQTEITKRDADTSVFFTLHERAVPNTPDAAPRRVINVAGTLNALDRVGPAQHHVDHNDFVRILSDIAKLPNTVDCIQMPLAAGEGRHHFLQLQLFKKDDGIGARIIDSTTNHPLATVPTDFVQRVLVENADSLQSILGAKRAHVYPVTTVRTNEQVRPADKKCPLYVAKGIEAATQAILSQGSHLLTQDVWAKNTVRHAHHVVSKTDEMALVFQLAKTKTVSDEVASDTDTSTDSDEDALHMEDDITQGQSAPVQTKPLEQDFLSEWDREGDDIATKEAQKSSVALSPLRHVERILDGLATQDKFAGSVEKALTQYLADRGGLKTSFFRQFSSAGKDYANDALVRISRNPAAALAVAREILHMGLQKDGQLEVKYNSRLDHLLKAFADNELINSLSPVGARGIKISLNDVTTSSVDREETASHRSSLSHN